MKRWKISSLLPQYIILYAVVALAPVLITLFSLVQSDRALQREILKSNHSSISLVQDTMDATIQDIQSVFGQLSSDHTFTFYALQSNPLEALNKLSSLAASHNYFYDIAVYSKSTDMFYTTSGRFTSQTVANAPFLKHPESSEFRAEDWIAAMCDAQYITFLPYEANPESPFLYLFAPLHHSNEIYASLVIPREMANNLFLASRLTSSDTLLLLDEHLNLLNFLEPENSSVDATDIQAYIQENPDLLQWDSSEWSEKGLLLFPAQSEKTGLTYVRCLPADVAYHALENQRIFTVITIIMAIVIALILVISAARQSYSPIRKLASWVRTQQPDAQSHPRNELTLFQTALKDAYSSNEALAETVNLSRQGMINHIVANLISGNYTSKKSFLADCQKHGICLDMPYYAVCTVYIEEEDDLPEFSQLVDTIRADLPEQYCIAIKDMTFESKILLVIGAQTADYDAYTVLVTDIKNRLLIQDSLVTSIGMGSFYPSYDLVGKSFLDSTNALDYRLVYGKDCLITPDIYNHNSPGLSDTYPSADLELLDSSLLSRNAEMATTVLHRINANIKLKSYSLHIAKYICYDIFSIFRKDTALSEEENGVSLPHTLDITNLTNYNTIDEFFSTLVALVENKFGDNHITQTPQQSNMGAQLLDYTDKHCLSYDFQAKTMAEHFNISPQYMRKLFKSHTGMSVSEYVSNKRLEKSMHLLAHTDMNLQDIVAQIGNSDISGFVRFFKQKTGMTPGQYRKVNQEPSTKA